MLKQVDIQQRRDRQVADLLRNIAPDLVMEPKNRAFKRSDCQVKEAPCGVLGNISL
jgi:hypothetical protein